MTLGQRISLCRKQRGMTQEELGEKLGVSRQAVSKWEGDQTTPDLQYLKIMCEEFGVTADWLLFEKDMNQRPEGVDNRPVMEYCPNCGEQVQDVLRRFIGCSDALEIYRDESAQKTLEELKESGAVPLAASAFRKKSENSGLGFWGVVGAVALAILIMSFL